MSDQRPPRSIRVFIPLDGAHIAGAIVTSYRVRSAADEAVRVAAANAVPDGKLLRVPAPSGYEELMLDLELKAEDIENAILKSPIFDTVMDDLIREILGDLVREIRPALKAKVKQTVLQALPIQALRKCS